MCKIIKFKKGILLSMHFHTIDITSETNKIVEIFLSISSSRGIKGLTLIYKLVYLTKYVLVNVKVTIFKRGF